MDSWRILSGLFLHLFILFLSEILSIDCKLIWLQWIGLGPTLALSRPPPSSLRLVITLMHDQQPSQRIHWPMQWSHHQMDSGAKDAPLCPLLSIAGFPVANGRQEWVGALAWTILERFRVVSFYFIMPDRWQVAEIDDSGGGCDKCWSRESADDRVGRRVPRRVD